MSSVISIAASCDHQHFLQVNAAINSHRVDTPGLDARANRRARFALLLASFCTWKEGSSQVEHDRVAASASCSFVDVPMSIETQYRQTIQINHISPTKLPCPYSPVNFGESVSASRSPSPASDQMFDYRESPLPVPLMKEGKGDRVCGTLDNLRHMVSIQSKDRSRSRGRSRSAEASPSDTCTSVDSTISHPPPQPYKLVPWQNPVWKLPPTQVETVHFACLC